MEILIAVWMAKAMAITLGTLIVIGIIIGFFRK